MTRGSAWILFICCYVQNVISEAPKDLLLALKQKFLHQPDCTPLFEIRHPGYISPNASAHPSIGTDEECASACIREENCMSYQVDSRPGGTFCRLQTSYSIENLQGPFSAAEVKEHVFTVKCVNSTSKEKCAPLIEARLRNWNSRLAREAPSVKTEMQCRTLCLDDQDCVSYQIHVDSTPGRTLCYIQKELSMFDTWELYMGREVREYFVVDRCLDKYEVSNNTDCSPVFKKLKRRVSQMAKSYPLFTTEQLCRLRCLFDPDCVSYQIDRNPEEPFCFIQTNGDKLAEAELTERALVTEYILVDSCTNKPLENTTKDCKPFIIPKPYPGVSKEALPHAEVRNYTDCQQMCVASPTCVSFHSMTSADVYCWIQNNWTHLMPNWAHLEQRSSEYVVVRKCPKEPSHGILRPGYIGNVSKTTNSSSQSLEPSHEVLGPGYIGNFSNTTNLSSQSPGRCSKHDVVFAICTTGIIPGDIKSETRLKALKSFLSQIVAGLKVTGKTDQVALVTFERSAYIEFYLNSYGNSTQLAGAIDKFGCHKCRNDETSAASALSTIKKEVLTKYKGYRTEASQIVVIITDRWWTVDLATTDRLVTELRNAGAFVILVGVTDALDEEDLRLFATPTLKGKSQQLLWAENFASLNKLVPKVNKTIETIAC